MLINHNFISKLLYHATIELASYPVYQLVYSIENSTSFQLTVVSMQIKI